MGNSTVRAPAALLAAATAALLGCATGGGAPGSLPEGSPEARAALADPLPPPPPLFRRTTAVRTAHVEAEMVRRQAGEWVIVKLQTEAEIASETPSALQPPRRPSARESEIHAALDAYEAAIERRSEDQLAQVWLMNPAQRSEVDRMFAESDGISVSISDPVVTIAGDRARVAFEQSFSMVRGPRVSGAFGRAYRRAMAASDAVGNWAIDSLSLK